MIRLGAGAARARGALALALVVGLAGCTSPGPQRLPDGGNDFIWPVEGTLLSAYGPKPAKRFNDGVNIAAPAGTPIRAAADGVVIYTGNELRSFGNLILIRHAAGWSSAYAHTEAVRVRRNQRVGRGAIIAAVGRSGSVACPQLHFELRRDAQAIDPFAVLDDRPRALKAGATGAAADTGCTPEVPAQPADSTPGCRNRGPHRGLLSPLPPPGAPKGWSGDGSARRGRAS